MSKVTRIALAVLISLGVIIAIYTSVQGAPLGARQDTMGAHVVNRSVVNLDQYRSPETAPAMQQSDYQPGKGHDCNSENQPVPDD